jgi:DNA-binding transcriptional regulator YdaS (Cro superfamily)
MPTPRNNPKPVDKKLVRAEAAGQAKLHEYCRAKHGNQAAIVRKTGIYPATLSRMANGLIPIPLEAAILIAVATDGALTAEQLCPSKAELLAQFAALNKPTPDVTM